MKKALLKDSFKEIIKTYKRFISILLMAFLGVGFFAGVRATSPDMKLTIDKYYDNQNLYDINVLSTLGLTQEDINEINKISGVEKTVGIYSEDVFVDFESEESVVKTYSLEDMNNVEIIEGRLPESADECVIESSMKTAENISLGDFIEIRENLKENEESSFKNTKLKVVGTVKSPLYISRDRGTTTLGSGKIKYYMYLSKENINTDIFTEIDIAVKNAKELSTLDEKYSSLIENVEDNLEKIKEDRQTARYNELIEEANSKLNDAQNDFNTEKADAEKKIADAEKEIADGKKQIEDSENKIVDSQKELDDAKNTANTEFANAQNQINETQNKLIISQETLDSSKKEFEANKKKIEESKKTLEFAIQQYNDSINMLNQKKQEETNNLAIIEERLSTTNQEIVNIETTIEQYKKELELASEEEKAQIQKNIDDKQAEKQTKLAQIQSDEKDKVTKQAIIEEYNNQINKCNDEKKTYEQNLNQINQEFTNAENQLIASQNQISSAWETLMQSKSKLEQTQNETNKKFSDAEKEIQNGKIEIENGKKEIKDAEKELTEKKTEFNEKIADAEAKLIDAREKVNDIEKAKWYILDRYDNTGFNSYSQDTDNVKKLGEVFPIVFFIIATLISLTSMSRMVEEQRVQIGTLKALRI